MNPPRVYADFNGVDPQGRVRLNAVGSIEDLAEQGLQLREGLRLIVYDGELEADGVAQFSAEARIWVAEIDWAEVRSGPEDVNNYR